jgi:hypothetical protein
MEIWARMTPRSTATRRRSSPPKTPGVLADAVRADYFALWEIRQAT